MEVVVVGRIVDISYGETHTGQVAGLVVEFPEEFELGGVFINARSGCAVPGTTAALADEGEAGGDEGSAGFRIQGVGDEAFVSEC